MTLDDTTIAEDAAPTRSTGQEARRRRVVQAALELAKEGGYEAVQMRDVATTAGVALGTIYRYFSSKDHLLAEAQVEWVVELGRKVRNRPPRGDRTVTRVVDVLRRATRAMEAEPKLAAALVTALASSDPEAARCQSEVSVAFAEIVGLAFPAEADVARRDDIVRTLGHVWFSALIGTVNGWYGLTKAGDELELAAHLLLERYED